MKKIKLTRSVVIVLTAVFLYSAPFALVLITLFCTYFLTVHTYFMYGVIHNGCPLTITTSGGGGKNRTAGLFKDITKWVIV